MDVELEIVFVPIEDEATLARWWRAINEIARLTEEFCQLTEGEEEEPV